MKLYTELYSEIHKGKVMAFAVREGILRKYHSLIIDDLKFLTRKEIHVILYHNIGNNKGNNIFLKDNIISKLPNDVDIKRIPSNKDLYAEILNIKQDVDKLIILERQFLISEEGKRINTISTNKLKSATQDNEIHNLGIGNINLRQDLLLICKSIELGNIHRVHILPASKKKAIKHELFSLEGSGTLIGNDFGNPDILNGKKTEEDIILGILASNKGNPYLKLRTKKYVSQNIGNFRVAKIDNIPVGCMEIIKIDENTIELGALAVIHSFLSFKIGLHLVEFIEKYAKNNNKKIISLTNSPKLQSMYKWRGFNESDELEYLDRKDKSPGVKLFVLDQTNI